MKHASIAAVLCTALVSFATAESQSLLGLWKTQEESGVVEMFRCGEAICGRVVDAASLRANPDQRDVHNDDEVLQQRRVKGLVILKGFIGGPRKWTGGPLYDPKSGDGAKHGSLTLEDTDTLKVKGCLVAFLCRTQTWTRID